MPNYSIPAQLREHIKQRALLLAGKPRSLALSNFPLTTAQIQYHCAALNDEQVGALQRLSEQGVRTIEHHRQIRLALLRDNLPALRRGVVLGLQLPERIFVGRGTQWAIPTTKFDVNENHYIVPRLDQLGERSRQELAAWIERALRQERLYEITGYCVEQILLQHHTPTTAHLHAFWPTLTTLVDPAQYTYSSERQKYELWRDRFRNPTRSLKNYQPDADVKNRFYKLIMAANTMLSAGLMLPTPSPSPKTIQATIEHWERLPGDPTFPLPA